MTGENPNITYFINGNIDSIQYYDKKRKWHRDDNLPDFKAWYPDGFLYRQTYYIHGILENNNNPAVIVFTNTGNIDFKEYAIAGKILTKLNWRNQIKNV